MRISFTVTGAPRTKKNHGERWRPKGSNRVLTVPSKAWREWAQFAVIENMVPFQDYESVQIEVNCRALFYRDACRGDAVGYYQGLADLLEKRGVVQDDKLVVSWDGSRLLIDRENPRTEVVLEGA